MTPIEPRPPNDPRPKSSRYNEQTSVRFISKQFEFSPTQFIIDESYVGTPPKLQISFENLNDNIDENFLKRDLSKLGKIRTLEIFRHPDTRQHLGLAKVEFEDIKAAQVCVETYNGKQVMGKQLSVYPDAKFVNIEKRKHEKLNPQPIVVNVETPKPQLPLPPLPLLTPLPFPPVQLPQLNIDLPRSLNRQHASLDDRLAKLGLKPSNPIPAITPQVFQTPEKSNALQPFHQNHTSNKPEKRYEQKILPPSQPPAKSPTRDAAAQQTLDDNEKGWNPQPSPVKANIKLNDDQISNEVLPFCYNKFFYELKKNLLATLRKKLVHTYGYPCIEEAQNEYKSKQNKLKLEQESKDLEAKYMSIIKDVDKTNTKQQPKKPQATRSGPVRRVLSGEENTLRRKNRSAALNNTPFDSRSEGSSDRRSRTPSRRGSSSGSQSPSSGSSSSSRSVSPSASSDSYSRSSSHSSYSSSSSVASKANIITNLAEPKLANDARLSQSDTFEIAQSLLELSKSSSQSIKEKISEPIIEKSVTKKRKKKEEVEKSPVIKKVKTEGAAEKVFKHAPRTKQVQEELIDDLTTISDEDIDYLKIVHVEWQKENQTVDSIRIPFGSEEANKVHINQHRETIAAEMKSKAHPKLWEGCSRCNGIKISDQGKIQDEEMNYEDLTKAPIKSHVIQAANSTRRDQRSDQRRIAALNPEIDPSFLKQFTFNTLQMRAKNLRFSRSKIHKWGLFACEKIANGDAVIEYVGEKIRPSLADHREDKVYPNEKSHDGSSYFFRVDTDVIDATFKGNKARFINHSCNPNCIAKVIRHENGTNSIVIYAKQTINEDEEITYDYKFPREEGEKKIRCNCKAPNCQKYLN